MLLEKKYIHTFIFLIFLYLGMPIQAQNLNDDINKLALSTEWLNLGHYRLNLMKNRYISEADTQSFFLTESGFDNPLQELSAWEKLLNSGQKTVPKTVCKFPARYIWTVKAFKIKAPWALDECQELQHWLNRIPEKELSIIFASAYLESPSSMFGHSFFRFRDGNRNKNMRSNTINYAADTSNREGIIDFAYRGLFGGFPGVTDQLPMYHRMRTYLDNEGRDLVEYYLNLSSDEVLRIKLHLFEIRGHDFEYYFIDENCSYRLLAVIATVKPELDLLDKFQWSAIPMDTIKTLEQNNLVFKVVDWHSAQRKLYFHNNFLSEDESQTSIAIALGDKLPSELPAVSNERKAKILYVAAEYNSLLIDRDLINRDNSKSISNSIVKERLNLNTTTSWEKLPSLKHVGDGHDSGRYTIAVGQKENQNFIDLNYRFAYHSFDDPIYGFNPGAEVIVLNYGIRGFDDSLILNKLDIIQVKSRTPVTPFFSSPSWDFGLSYLEKYFSRKDQHVISMEYLKGRSYLIGDHILSGMVGMDTDFSNHFKTGYGFEAVGKISVMKQSELYSYYLSYRAGRYVSGINNTNKSLSLDIGIPISNDLLTLSVKRKFGEDNYQTELGLGFSRYF